MATVYNCSLANVSDISRQAKRVNSGVRSTVLYCKAETGERWRRVDAFAEREKLEIHPEEIRMKQSLQRTTRLRIRSRAELRTQPPREQPGDEVVLVREARDAHAAGLRALRDAGPLHVGRDVGMADLR